MTRGWVDPQLFGFASEEAEEKTSACEKVAHIFSFCCFLEATDRSLTPNLNLILNTTLLILSLTLVIYHMAVRGTIVVSPLHCEAVHVGAMMDFCVNFTPSSSENDL